MIGNKGFCRAVFDAEVFPQLVFEEGSRHHRFYVVEIVLDEIPRHGHAFHSGSAHRLDGKGLAQFLYGQSLKAQGRRGLAGTFPGHQL